VAGDSRRYPQRPILGVGALIFNGDRILLCERGKEPLKGWWSIPGGVVEVGERLEAAIIREVREETCLDVKPARVFEIFERIMPDADGRPEYHYVLIDYVCDVLGGTLQACDDVSSLVWATRDELSQYKLTEGTLGVIEKAYEANQCRSSGI
jgi:8-oxo-dGTP diphosphatase